MPRAENSEATAFCMAEIIASLMWGPKTSKELQDKMEVSCATIWRCTSALHESGVIRKLPAIKNGLKGHPPNPWALQVKPFELADEP